MFENFGKIRNLKPGICLLLFAFCLLPYSTFAQTLAPGAPGRDAQWASAGKQGVGTSAGLESKVWFTLEGGALTEVYYPDVTVANVHLLQFVVVNPKTKKVETERDDANHQIKVLRPDSLSFQQINTAKSGVWQIEKTYATDIERNAVQIAVRFSSKDKDQRLYVYYDPSLNNSGMHDNAWSLGNALLAQDGDKASALVISDSPWESNSLVEISSGFYQTSDGLEQLKSDGKITNPHNRAEKGNVAQIAKVNSSRFFTLVLGFGKTPEEALKTAQDSLAKGFTKTATEYEKGWADYIKTVRKVEPKYQAQFNMAAMQLKAHEDKTVRGANIASLSVPWGGGANANENNIGGYHLIWSRDLYQVATAFMALGDKAAAVRALDFLFKVQQKPDGSFPQNSYLDGKPFWGSLQLDEVAFPLILAYQLGRDDKATYENHVKRAADFIVKNGPRTPQERWEEEGGYSPSTIAAEIAGLVCAAEIARKNGDAASAETYLKTADEWQVNIEKWTATTSGKYGDGNYYLRITQNGKPDAGERIELNNGAGFFDEREIVDAGFLELVRLGIKPADDPLIAKSLKVIDEVIRVKTPNGEGFYRYNNDGYGEMDDGRRWNWDGKYTGKGRLWALLSGERGQFELALHLSWLDAYNNRSKNRTNSDPPIKTPPPKPSIDNLLKAKERLKSMASFANDGLMIPEQIWDKAEVPKNIDRQFIPELKFGEGTGSATPLAWSMAQFIRLAVNLQAGKNLDTPDIVYNRYVLGKKSEVSSQNSVDESNKRLEITTSCYSEWLDKNKEKVLKQSPIIIKCKDEVSQPIFVYSGKGENVEVVGDFTGWKPQKLVLTRYQPYAPVEGDFLEFSRFYPLGYIAPTARVEYKLIVDGKWITDPLNPNKVDNGVGGENSFFAMPDYKPTIWSSILDNNKTDIPAYIPRYIESIEIDSGRYGKAKVGVYNPNSGAKEGFPVLYIQDGGEYQSKARAVEIQNNLVKAGKIKPFIMVFLDPKDRMKDYWASDDYAKFLAEEVVPAIDAKYKTIRSRDGRAILGASLGGITSFHTAVKYPEIFGRVGGQSSSFWIDGERVVKALEKLDSSKNKFVFYIDDGTLEGVEDSRRVNVLLRGKGFDVTYLEAETGHNWTSWRDRLADAFIALWK